MTHDIELAPKWKLLVCIKAIWICLSSLTQASLDWYGIIYILRKHQILAQIKEQECPNFRAESQVWMENSALHIRPSCCPLVAWMQAWKAMCKRRGHTSISGFILGTGQWICTKNLSNTAWMVVWPKPDQMTNCLAKEAQNSRIWYPIAIIN